MYTRILCFACFLLLLLCLSLLAGCKTGQKKEPAAEAFTEAQFDRGKEVFEQRCQVCHPLNPPAKLAPPILGISGHYHDAFTDRDAAIRHMVDYIQHPAAEKSKLEPMAMERFGIMAPMVLPEEDLEAVAYWIWSIRAAGMKAPAAP